MDLSAVAKFFQHFQTARVVAYLRQMKVQELIHNPWFLGGAALFTLVALIMRWRTLLIGIIGLGGFIALISYTLQHSTQLNGLDDPTLLVVIVGGAVLVGLVLYLFFIKSE